MKNIPMKDLQKKIEDLILLYKEKKYSEVEKITKSLLKKNPKIAILYNIKGLTLSDQGKFNEAIDTYKEGLKIDPNFTTFYNNLGNAYKLQNNLSEAEKFYRECIKKDGKIFEAYNNLGNLLRKQSKYEESIINYKKSIELNDNFFFAHYNLGTSYITLGKFQEAQISLEKTIKLNPYFAKSHRALSRIKKYNKNDKHLIQMKYIFQSKKITEEQKIDLSFALGKAHEDTKDYVSSFFYYRKGNELHRKTIKYTTTEISNDFHNIKNKYNKEVFKKFEGSGSSDASPIFIVGMPRSGTTLVEQIISSHHSVFGADELNFIPELEKKSNDLKNFTHENFKEIGKEYVKKIKIISNNSQTITDKLPLNFMWIGFIKLILPNSTIIHVKRNSFDNCFSIYKNHFASNVNFAYDLNEIKSYYNLYQNLMVYWQNLLPNKIIEVTYEDLVNNPEQNIITLIKNCNLNWDDECLKYYQNKRPIKTASDAQARKNIYKSSIGSWKNYKLELEYFFKDLEN